MPEIRCANKKFGVVTTDATGIFEALCNSRWCGASSECIVYHRWDLGKPADSTGVLIPYETDKIPKTEVGERK